MENISISVGIVPSSFENFKKFCAHFNCKVSKNKDSYFIESDDAINFFWLGMNMNFRSDSRLSETPADKYLKPLMDTVSKDKK